MYLPKIENKNLKKLLVIVGGIVLFSASGISQNQRVIDSLQNKLKQLETDRVELRDGVVSLRDSSIAKILSELSWEMKSNNYFETAMDYAKQGLALSEQIGWKKGVIKAYKGIGNAYSLQDNYSEALKNYFLALKICKETGDKKEIAGCYNNIGTVYFRLGNYAEALKMQYTSLKIKEELKDKTWITNTYTNIGNINVKLGNYPEALMNYSVALRISEELGDKGGIAAALGNMGLVYDYQGDYPSALKNFFIALKMTEQIGNKSEIAKSYSNIGYNYFKQGQYHEALNYYLTSLKIREGMPNKGQVARLYSSIGEVNVKLKRASEGRAWLQKGLRAAKQIGSKDIIAYSLEGLVAADSALSNYKSALENYKMLVIYKDSLSNNENTKKITQQQMQYDFDKKEALTKADQEKKDAVALEEIENQKLVRNGFMGGFATVLVFAGTFFRQRNRIKKEKKRSDHLLRNILPDEVAEELKETGGSKAKTHKMVSVMFTDFKDFTKISETVSAEMLVDELHTCFSAFDNILHKHNIEKIKTIGDAYMCVSGLPVSSESHAADMVSAAVEIMDYVKARKIEKDAKKEFAFELRIGINSGPVVAGIVGLKKFSYDIWGDTVNTAARMEHQGEAGKINISGTTNDLVKNKFTSTHRGKITAKNKGEIDMYFID